MKLTIATPFAGYETPYLERWLADFVHMVEGVDASVLWLYNGSEKTFFVELQHYASAMPLKVETRWEPFPVLGHTEGFAKNNLVALAHFRNIYEISQCNPESWLFLHESDVIVPAGGIAQLREGLEKHPAIGAISGATPECRSRDPLHIGTMAWRIQLKSESRYTLPQNGQVVHWYLPEVSEGVEICDAIPFGALLTRLSAFEKVPLATKLFPALGLDQEWSQNMLYVGNMPVAVDWGVWCGHYRRDFNPDWEDLRARMTTGVSTKVGLAASKH